MVSKASDDLPEPDKPVKTISVSRGSTTSMFLRLCSRAPRTTIVSLIGVQRSVATHRERTFVRHSVRRLETGRDVRTSRLADLAELAFQLVDLVAQACGLLEAQVAGGVLHLVGEVLDEARQLVARQVEAIGDR